LIEWPEGAAEPDHYWLSTIAVDVGLEHMVDLAKPCWRIERDYLELKQEVGLGHYEGRGWRGFHHHATLRIAAYGFLISEKETIPPSGASRPWRGSAICPFPWLPTQRICRCDHNAYRHFACVFVSRALRFLSCRAVPAAGPSARRVVDQNE
jgi:SRSO17 transposase